MIGAGTPARLHAKVTLDKGTEQVGGPPNRNNSTRLINVIVSGKLNN